MSSLAQKMPCSTWEGVHACAPKPSPNPHYAKHMPQKPQPEKPKGKGFKLKTVADASASLPAESGPIREAFENLGDLPHGYGVDTIFLVAQEPHWLFTYWDIDIAKHPGGAATLRYHTPAGLEGEIEVPFETRNWYVPVREAATDYFVEIGFYRDRKWNPIARSVTVTTPPDGVATAETFDYATIPFHLSFQRLLDNLENAAKSGEDLLSAVSRLQQDGDFSAFGKIGFQDLLPADQATLVGAFLGSSLAGELSSGAFSSGEVESRLRTFLEEHLGSSGGASEWLSSFPAAAGLFSGGAFSGDTAAASWSTALSSWVAGAGETSSVFASWLAAAGGVAPSSALTSWAQAALTSWGGATTSSWAAGGESSGAGVPLSSWLQGVQSSWAAAALTSWPSAEVTSWFSGAASTSWSGSSETSGSFGERGFFMHVNAEVIFYGGTDPRAKVTINGHPVVLNADGTFRYHFVFPNADHKIEITAESPDAVETRAAALDFHRATGKTGVVTDTPQPPLGEPMGRVS